MKRNHGVRWDLTAAMLIVVASLVSAAAKEPKPSSLPGPLVGQLLVATPRISDPQFYHTVILVVDQTTDGVLGLVINRPVDRLPVASLMSAIGRSDSNAHGDVAIFAGGPVQPELGFVIHSPDYRRAETRRLDRHLSLTSTPDVLRDIGRAHGPRRALVAFGYTGWAPGQLDTELARGDWATAPAEPDLVFDVDRDQLWDLAWTKRTVNL